MSVNKLELKSASLINKGIANIALTGKKLEDEIGRIAAMIVLHAVEYGDISAADRLCKAVAETGHRNGALGKWFVDTGCARIKSTKDGDKTKTSFGVDEAKAKAIKERIAKTSAATVAGELRAVKWNLSKPKEDTYQGFNLESLLRSLTKRADKALKEHGDDPKTVIDRNMLARVKALYLFENPEAALPALHDAGVHVN
jgi:hypothetical protein